MGKLETVLEQLTGEHLISQLTDVLQKRDSYYLKIAREYNVAICKAQQLLSEQDLLTLNNYIASYNQKIQALLVFSGYQGIRINLENFRNPIGVNFLKEDPTDYLKEHIAISMPVYSAGCHTQYDYFQKMSEQCATFEYAVSNYYTYLETVGPKLAHYAGYLLGNTLLAWVEPGYVPDSAQTSTYAMIMDKYIGFHPFS